VPYGYPSNDVFNAKAQNGPVSWKAIRPGGQKTLRLGIIHPTKLPIIPAFKPASFPAFKLI
jgi:hypothetical protein